MDVKYTIEIYKKLGLPYNTEVLIKQNKKINNNIIQYLIRNKETTDKILKSITEVLNKKSKNCKDNIYIGWIIFRSFILVISKEFITNYQTQIPQVSLLAGWLVEINRYKIILDILGFTKKIHVIIGEIILKLINIGFMNKYTSFIDGKLQVFLQYNNAIIEVYFNFYTENTPYNIISYKDVDYTIGSSIHTLAPIIKKNKFNHNYPTINLSAINTMNNIRFIVDEDLLNILKALYEKYYNFQEVDILYQINECKEDFDKKINIELKKLQENENSLENIDRSKNNEEVFNKYLSNKNKISQQMNLLEDEKNNKISLLLEVLKLCKVVNLFIGGEVIYFDHFADFRSRRYSKSPLSPITNKFMRNILTYGKYTEDEISTREDSTSDKILKNYYYLIDEFNIKKDADKSAIIWLFIELVKDEKSKHLNQNHAITLEKFIKEGIEIYKKPSNNYTDIISELQFMKNIYFIDLILSNKNTKKFFLLKDSTASVLQHLTNWLKPRNENTLRICNINSSDHTWFDTYSIVIENFLKLNITKINKENVKYFKRKYLKKSIMTINYGVSQFTAWRSFKESLNLVISTANDNTLFEDFKLFYKYLLYDLEQTMYSQKSDSLLGIDEVIINNNKIYLEYYKTTPKVLDIKAPNNRLTVTMQELTTTKDFEKQKKSNRANLMHVSDAVFAELIINKKVIYCVHDEFLTDIYNTCNIIDYANEVFNKYLIDAKLNNKNMWYTCNKTYSIFILL